QVLRISVRQRLVPQFPGDLAGAGGYPGSIHEAEGRFHAYHDNGAGGRRVELRHKWLVNPTAGQGHSVGNLADQRGEVSVFLHVHEPLPLGNACSTGRTSPGLPVSILLLDPRTGCLQSLLHRRMRLPIEDPLDHGVIAVAAGDTPRSLKVILALEPDPCDLFDEADQTVDGKKLTRAKVDGSSNQVVAVHDHVYALDAVIDVHETARGSAIAPDHDLVLTAVLRFDDFAADGRWSFFAATFPSAIRAVNVVKAGDEGLHPALGPVFLTEHFRHELLPAVAPFSHGGVGIRLLQGPGLGPFLQFCVVGAGRRREEVPLHPCLVGGFDEVGSDQNAAQALNAEALDKTHATHVGRKVVHFDSTLASS